ncbi:MAG: alpha/beta hydrolase [Bacillota bacterium]|jgi:pimeloyl-ACP methyl ester carboxylesterase|nr:alpha/beta hydrolase [Bacillota bacterium]
MLFNIKTSKLNINNIEMDYITFGKGDKPLIMIQGLNTNGIKGAGFLLAYMYRIFIKDYKIYIFDRRKKIYEDITVEDFAYDISLAMDKLNIKNAYILGVSQGGMIAQYIAINRPDLVNKLVLALTLSRNNKTVESVINNWIKLTKENDMKNLIIDMFYKIYSQSYIKKYKLFIPLLTIIQKPKDKKRFIILVKSCLTCDTYDDLNKIKCPVFVIGAKNDEVVGSEASIEIAKKLNCKLYMYDDLGHGAYGEAKDFNEKVYSFLMNKKSSN